MTKAATLALIALATAAFTWIVSFIPMHQPMEWTRAGDWYLRIVGTLALGVAAYYFFFHRQTISP